LRKDMKKPKGVIRSHRSRKDMKKPKGVIRSHRSKKDRQYNGQKKKRQIGKQ
jgi:hypothetical protein